MVVYARTGGCHGAALLGADGVWLDQAEDVGRHNAVDKLLGARFHRDDYPLERPVLLLVSGRLSFDLVQKAALAGVSALAGLGAPTSLAIESSTAAGLRLYGLVRDGGANDYSTGSSRSVSTRDKS